MNLRVLALLSGFLFGVWPLLMNRSGVGGNISSVAFSGTALIVVGLAAILGRESIPPNANWLSLVVAGVIGALGLLCFNGMLGKATKEEVGTLFVLMIVVQVAIPATYSVIMNGGITTVKAIGFVLAIVAGILLSM